MNHTERIAETARYHRYSNQRTAKQAIETYLELLAEEMVEGVGRYSWSWKDAGEHPSG